MDRGSGSRTEKYSKGTKKKPGAQYRGRGGTKQRRCGTAVAGTAGELREEDLTKTTVEGLQPKMEKA